MTVAAVKKAKPRRKANIPLANVGMSNSSRQLKERNETLIELAKAKLIRKSQ